MSGLLDEVMKDFDRRMGARRLMEDHLGIAIPQDRAEGCCRDTMATLLACKSCDRPDICRYWVRSGQDGLPQFCMARESFLRLQQFSRAATRTIGIAAE